MRPQAELFFSALSSNEASSGDNLGEVVSGSTVVSSMVGLIGWR